MIFMHPRPPGRHIGIDSYSLILSFELKFFLCADMFPCEDSKNRVCPYPEKKNHLSFVNISPTLVIDTSMERFHEYYTIETQKFYFFPKKFEIRILTCD